MSSQPNCRDKAGSRLLLPVMFAAAFVLSTVTCLTGQARVTQTPLQQPISDSPIESAAVAGAQASSAESQANVSALNADSGMNRSDLLIASGDLLEISVYGAPEFDKLQVRVNSNGDAVLPFIGAQHVQGLTAAKAQELISRKLAEGRYFQSPQVVVFVREYSSQGVFVLGEVQKPGVYPLFGAKRLLDVISMAGGLTPKAGKIVTIAHRDDKQQADVVVVGSDVQGSVDGNKLLIPGDTVMISKAGIVYVVGDVRLPGGFVMENGHLTVLQALSLAQGANSTASLNNTTLIRTTNGKKEQTQVALKRILSAHAEDLPLQPGDILFVPASLGKSAARRSLEAIVQTATGLAIYGR